MKLTATSASRLPAPPSCSGAEAADLVDEHGAEAELAEGIGEVGGDREGAAEAEQDRWCRPRRGSPAARSMSGGGDACGGARSIEAMALSAKPSRRSPAPLAPRSRAGAEPGQALAIVRPARLELGAEDLLQVGEAGIADGLGEADQGRGLDLGLGGDARHRAEGDLVGILQGEGGDLDQAARQVLATREQEILEAVIVAGRSR